MIFRAEKYPLDFIGFNNKNTSPKGNIEQGSTNSCNATNTNSIHNISVQLFPNPIHETLHIESNVKIEKIQLLNALGQLIFQENVNAHTYDKPMIYPKGIYTCIVYSKVNSTTSIRVVKN